jgi:hypothetical protein
MAIQKVETCCFFFYRGQNPAMEITRETVTEWLEENRRGREWLAEKCNLGIAAVGHWLNKKGEARPIPAEHQITIRALMEEDAAKKQAKPPHSIILEFNDEDYSAIEWAALEDKKSIREWAKIQLNQAANADMVKLAAEYTAKAAAEGKIHKVLPDLPQEQPDSRQA